MNVRARREPPRFRRAEVRRVERAGPRLARVTLGGPELDGLAVDQPAASVRVLLPPPGSTELVVPAWTGNEYRLPDGSRPPIRTLTPRYVRAGGPGGTELDLDVVLHGQGVASEWAERAEPGVAAAVSGPARGYDVDPGAAGYLLAGDETAVPAIGQLLEAIPPSVPVRVLVEVAGPDGRPPLPDHPGATVEWCDAEPGAPLGTAMVRAVQEAGLGEGTRVWVAGEAAAVQRVRRFLFEERGLPRSQATVRGYWKHGRSAEGDGDGD